MRRIFALLTTFRLLGYMGALMMILLAVLLMTAGDALAQQTIRVSVDSSGNQGDGTSENASISSDGRFVAFDSLASNLVAGDTNGVRDVFVHDTVTGETIRVSVDSSGNQGDGDSRSPSISSDGRYVAFYSYASNLVGGDTNGAWDVFVHDTVTGETTRVSVASSGDQGDGPSNLPSISSDGRYAAFYSYASNLVGGDTNGAWDVFVHDTVTGETTRVSVDSSGNQGDSDSRSPSISSDGRYVAFESWASNLVAGDTNGAYDVFVHDTVTGETTRVSVDSSGNQGDGHSLSPSISSDGRFVAFDSPASNLVAGDTNGAYDVFVHERHGALAVTVLVPNGGEVIPSGSPYTIQWEAPPDAVSFKLKYSMDNGRTWKTIHSGITETSYDWTVPRPRKNKKKCLVKVIGYDGSDKKVGADRSDGPFTIEVVKLTSPNGGETMTPGDMPTITWETNETKRDVAKVKLLYTKNGGKKWIPIYTFKGENPGSYDEWTVPEVPKVKSKCKVKVVLKDGKGNTVGKDTSDGYFTIQP